MMKSVFLVLAVALFATAPVVANEGGGEKKEEKQETKSTPPEWVEIQARLATLKAKISSKEKIVKEMIAAKQTEKDPKKSVEIVETLKREHRELRIATEEYEKERNLLRYRFPEKGLKEQQRYKRVEVRSIDEMETAMSLDGRLNRALGKVRRQYGDPETKASGASPAQHEESKTIAPPSITEPAVLTK